jgi:hypothetical protein
MCRVAVTVLLALLVVAPVVSQSAAEPPTGFSQFPWGTSVGVIRAELLATRCRSSTESWDGWYSVLCLDYRIDEISVPSVRLDFEPADSLAGYSMTIARGSYRRFRDLAVQRFGSPTASSRSFPWRGSVMSWTSEGVTATLIEQCGAETACMEVTTRALDRKRHELTERRRREAAQGF